MMSENEALEPQVTTRFSPLVFRGLEKLAKDRDLDLPEAVETIVRERVVREKALDAPELKQVEAEASLYLGVSNFLLPLRDSGVWDKHVTKTVFEHLKATMLKEYEIAIGGDPFLFGNPEKGRINKRIGAQVKRALRAEVVMTGAKREKGQPSRAEQALILSYTLLRRP